MVVELRHPPFWAAHARSSSLIAPCRASFRPSPNVDHSAVALTPPLFPATSALVLEYIRRGAPVWAVIRRAHRVSTDPQHQTSGAATGAQWRGRDARTGRARALRSWRSPKGGSPSSRKWKVTGRDPGASFGWAEPETSTETLQKVRPLLGTHDPFPSPRRGSSHPHARSSRTHPKPLPQYEGLSAK